MIFLGLTLILAWVLPTNANHRHLGGCGAASFHSNVCEKLNGLKSASDVPETREALLNTDLAGTKIAKWQTVQIAAGDSAPNQKTPVPTAIGAYTSNLTTGSSFQDCEHCPQMVIVPAGTFLMGDLNAAGTEVEKPVHRVTISRPFAVGKFEVTQAQWKSEMGGNPSHFKGDARPVDQVSWRDAQQYIKKLNNRLHLSGRPDRYRLLSEAEWEYVARAGTTTKYFFGNSLFKIQANFAGNKTFAVGRFPANTFGIHDIHGNLFEWIEDCWNDNYIGAPTDGKAWLTGNCDTHVLRGGSYNYDPKFQRTAFRFRNYFFLRYSIFGFRVARSLPR